MPGEYCALVEASVLDNLGKKFYLGEIWALPKKVNPPPGYNQWVQWKQ